MSDQATITMQADVTQAPGYQYVGSEFQATTSADPQMTFVWSAAVAAASSSNPGITVTISYGGGTSTNNQQQAFIPWGYTNSYPIPSGANGQITVSGSVAATYSTDGSVVVTFTGSMVYSLNNNIICTGATVVACMAQS
jgi:hypothetical protein